ncbi:zinc finger CCHC domain-containing protein 10-like [Chenopodium quinoa]|uniref:zinc finger CCHC domain-containing protein 10-like n=1 Tax=Chenopodium quinoa TaxID=63459 RepID=UPI000B78EC78|nr:zinc finger CCHC domain-containing protein 10-like [Chenopodium quinoa]XP_021745201.1 zinc finger CCHC domain-containing protein 10-like [Chenopodium quinoa]XP_021745202.1 zinc finger CCHC domain-containing protein 10-like [Chenopodium quinoa]
MSSKKEEKAQAAADRIKAAALSAAKGLSRAQAERAATAAARNVNAYGQKEEGPSRWQERKEAKRQMYLMSTEKAVRLGERKDLKANVSAVGGAASQCQKCFQPGHWTYECKNERVYISRPSRSQILKNPKLRQKLMDSYNEDNPDIKREEIQEEEEKVEKKDKRKKKSKRKHKSDTESSTDASESDSDSRSSASVSDYSSESASDYSSSSDSEDERSRKRRNKKQKGRRKKYSSSSESSDPDSSSDSDSGKNRKSKKKHSRRR